MQTTKDRMLRDRVMEEHRELVRSGLYWEAWRILSLLRRGHVTLGLGDVDWAVEGILTRLGCPITIAGRHHLATAYLYCPRTR